jgi:hypothetical protein
MANQGGIEVTAFDGLQNGHHELRGLQAAQVDMDSVGGPPHPGTILRSSVVVVVVMHGKAPIWRARVINRYHDA